MRGVGGTLSPTRAARRKAPSSCCSYSAAPALSLCMSIAFLVFMATHLGGTRDSKVAHSQPTEVSTARKLSGEGVVLRRGYERARRGEGGRKMDLEEELEKDLHAGEPLHERGERERGKRSRTRGGEESFGQPNEVLQSEWMPAQEAKKGAAEGGVKKFSAQQGGEYVIDLGESEWERIQREGGTGGGTSKGGHSEPEIDGEGLRGVEIQGAFSKDKVGKMTKGEVEVNTPHGQGGGFGVQVDKGSSRETAKTNLEYESNSFKVKGALSPMQKAKWSSAGDIGAESIELDNLGQANQRLAWDTTGQHEKEKRFPAAEDSDWPDQVPGAVTVKVEDVGQANLLDSPKSAGSQMYPAQRADSGSRDARQTDRAQVKPPVTEDKDEFETQTSEGSGHSDQVHERPLLWPRDKPTKQVLMVKNFFQHNEIESSGHVLDDEGSSRRMGNDKPSDEDLALAVLPEFGVLSVDSLSARANNLSEADGSLQNVLNRTSNTEAPHLSVIKADNSFQKQERLINGRLEDVTYRQALLRSFQEGLDCMAPGLELFDGNASLMTGASAYGRCAFVGNSGMMRAAERGEEIDGHDVILRSNQAPTKGKWIRRRLGFKGFGYERTDR